MLQRLSPPASVIAWVPVQRMTFKWFVAINNHYVDGLFNSSGLILYLLQRVGVIDVGTQAVTPSHYATIQFCSATKRTGTYQYIILNVWLMPCAFQIHKNQLREATTIAYVLSSFSCSLFFHWFCVSEKAQDISHPFSIKYWYVPVLFVPEQNWIMASWLAVTTWVPISITPSLYKKYIIMPD